MFETGVSVPSDPDIVSSTSVTPVCELVAPGVLRQHIPEYSLAAPPRSRNPRTTTVQEVPDDDAGSVRRLAASQHAIPLTDDFDSDDEDDHVSDMRTPPPAVPTSSSTTARVRDGILRQAPTIQEATAARDDLLLKFRKPRTNAPGFVYLELNPFERDRLEGMRTMLNFYVDPKSKTYGHWGASSLQAAVSLQRGLYCARTLRVMVRAYITNRSILPRNPYGDWKTSMLCDQDLANDLMLHLQELGDGFTAASVVEYLRREDVKIKHGISKVISERTACRWLTTLGYRYRLEARGQYTDGHERVDVVWYRANVFVPAIQKVCHLMMALSSLTAAAVASPYYGVRHWRRRGLSPAARVLR